MGSEPLVIWVDGVRGKGRWNGDSGPDDDSQSTRPHAAARAHPRLDACKNRRREPPSPASETTIVLHCQQEEKET